VLRFFLPEVPEEPFLFGGVLADPLQATLYETFDVVGVEASPR
jgi:hypothetical protein